jgi:hypothetical protein
MTLLNMDYHEWEVTIHSDYDQEIIGCRQHFDENCFSRTKPINGLQQEGRTKLVRIIGSSEEGRWKEVMFTRIQLVAESARHRGVIELILWKTRVSTYGLRDGLS